MMDFDIFDWMIIGPASEDYFNDNERLKKIEEDYFDDESEENDKNF